MLRALSYSKGKNKLTKTRICIHAILTGQLLRRNSKVLKTNDGHAESWLVPLIMIPWKRRENVQWLQLLSQFQSYLTTINNFTRFCIDSQPPTGLRHSNKHLQSWILATLTGLYSQKKSQGRCCAGQSDPPFVAACVAVPGVAFPMQSVLLLHVATESYRDLNALHAPSPDSLDIRCEPLRVVTAAQAFSAQCSALESFA